MEENSDHSLVLVLKEIFKAVENARQISQKFSEWALQSSALSDISGNRVFIFRSFRLISLIIRLLMLIYREYIKITPTYGGRVLFIYKLNIRK